MGLFDVYVEGATDPSPVALERLAAVMSQRYGLPAGELQARLTKGRFRVKANVDDATAQTYLRDLEAVGARVTLVEARGGSTLPPPARTKPESKPPPHPITVSPRQRNESKGGGYSISRNSSAGIPLPDDELLPATPRTLSSNAVPAAPVTPRTLSSNAVPPPRTSSPSLPPQNTALPPRTSSPSLPPQNTALPPRTSSPSLPPSALPPRTSAPSLPPQTALPPRAGASNPPANTPFASGLSAAFGESGPVDANAFDSLSVGSLDDNAPQVETSPVLPASIGPAAVKAAPKVDKPKDVPMDLFAPPESQGAEFKVELAAEEIAHRERKRTPASAVPIAVPPSPTSPVLRPKLATERSAGVRMPSLADEAPRGRFAIGVIVSVALGFVPATLVHSCREDAAFEKIDHHVATVQEQAATNAGAPIPFAKLDEFRDEQLAKKKSERRNIAIVSLLIWGLAGAAIGYVWFRRVPWDKLKFG